MRFLYVAVIFGATAFGQNDRGTIAGIVRDSWGVGIAEATVQAKNTQTGATVKGVSGTGGKYTLADLPPETTTFR